MVMLGSVSKAENEFGRLTKQPDEIGGMETQSPYFIVSQQSRNIAFGTLRRLVRGSRFTA